MINLEIKKPKKKDFLFVFQSNEVKQPKTKTELAVEGEIDETKKKLRKGKIEHIRIGNWRRNGFVFVCFVRSFVQITHLDSSYWRRSFDCDEDCCVSVCASPWCWCLWYFAEPLSTYTQPNVCEWIVNIDYFIYSVLIEFDSFSQRSSGKWFFLLCWNASTSALANLLINCSVSFSVQNEVEHIYVWRTGVCIILRWTFATLKLRAKCWCDHSISFDRFQKSLKNFWRSQCHWSWRPINRNDDFYPKNFFDRETGHVTRSLVTWYCIATFACATRINCSLTQIES